MKNNNILILGLTLVVVIASGCANGHRGYGGPKEIIIDTKGVDLNAYYDDLGDCEQYARNVDVGAETTEGAVAGAVLGGVLGAVLGNSDNKAHYIRFRVELRTQGISKLFTLSSSYFYTENRINSLRVVVNRSSD